MRVSSLLSVAALIKSSIAGYVLEDDYMKDFYGMFNFFTDKDPTNGFVKFVDQKTAASMQLINSTDPKSVEWGVDAINKAPAGRSAIRLESKKKYNSGLIVIDVAHMPFGCGTWPAFWTVGTDWPNNGEIDIIEGVNEQVGNAVTLHTGTGCMVGQTSGFSGSLVTQNCDVNANGQYENAGCQIKTTSQKSYGGTFNSGGGGVFATQWTDEQISVFFWPRNAIPNDTLGDSPDPNKWGVPAAKFDGGCNIGGIFKNHQIVFDTTFCGQWAGAVWSTSSCAKKAPTCNDFVRDHPEAFEEAFWKVNALKVYQNGGATAPPPAGTATPVSKPIGAIAPAATSSPAILPAASSPTVTSSAVTSSAVTSSAVTSSAITSPAASSLAATSPTVTSPAANLPAGPGGIQPGFTWPKGSGNKPKSKSEQIGGTPASTGAKPQASGPPVDVLSINPTDLTAEPLGAKPSGYLVGEMPGPKSTCVGDSQPYIRYVPAVARELTETLYETIHETKHVTHHDHSSEEISAPKARVARYATHHRRKWSHSSR